MASINFATREINCKIVYYGPGLSGKTTNLQIVHQKLPKDKKSDMVSLATEQDRTLFFDFLPLDLGSIKGFKTKFQLYTVPGQVYYNSTRKLVLRGVDGVVFVADSQPTRMAENKESLINLRDNLSEYGLDLDELPFVIQYNKRDLPDILDIPALQEELNPMGVVYTEATAHNGFGVIATLKLAAKKVIEKFNSKGSSAFKRPGPSAAKPAPKKATPPTPSSTRVNPASTVPPVKKQVLNTAPPTAPITQPAIEEDDDSELLPYTAPQTKSATPEPLAPIAASAPPSFDDDDDDDFDEEDVELRPYIPRK